MRAFAIALTAALLTAALLPAAAAAHGPIAPVASSYLAKVATVPPGIDAKVIDGDQRMWFSVAPHLTVIVVDYRGAPYLRFGRSGVDVNRNSSMYYLNQTPAEVPPASLGPATAPHWSHVSSGHRYEWHDGRLHALASVALAPGASYVGRWSIPLRVDGRASTVSGGVWHADAPSLVWFWGIVVLLACTLAARRVRRPSLDARVGRALALPALVAIAAAAVARGMHGRPTLSGLGVFGLVAALVFVAWGLRQVLLLCPSYFTYLAIAFVALWEGAVLIPTLLDGFVLLALPAAVTRAAAVLCLGCGAALLVVRSRFADDGASDVAPSERQTAGATAN